MTNKKIVNKALTFGVCTTLMLGQVPAASVLAFAAETSDEGWATVGSSASEADVPLFEQFTFEDTQGETSEELFAGYVEQTLYKSLYEQLYSDTAAYGNYGETHLNTLEKYYYHKLKSFIEDVAAGRQATTGIEIPIGSASEAELGKPFNQLTGDEVDRALQNVFHTLLVDCPYDLYWFDKTDGVSGQYRTESGKVLEKTYLGFDVLEAYQDTTAGTYAVFTTNTAVTKAASQTVSRAQAVVNQYAALPDYEKMCAYKDWICAQVTYNRVASASSGYGDPWQVIYVFDNDSSTNVVCEGYAKAFQYLCDLSTFASGSTQSYLVDGDMNEAAHMWNVVTLTGANGTANYLVDLTNTDNDGAPDKTGVFFNGAIGGSLDGGYTFRHSASGNLTYTFDVDQMALYGTDPASILNLSMADYVPPTNPEPGTDPSTPDTPGTDPTPEEPDTPDNPDVPDTPDTPDTPDEPTNPDTPDTPDTPSTNPDPVEPEKPSTPDPDEETHLTGWVQKGNSWYYYNAQGTMQTGWVQQGKTWYYCNASGVMQTGWQHVGGSWYYFNTSGAMQTGWLQQGKTWYYLAASGAMATGWHSVGGTWYYFNASGVMQTGWLQSGGTWYYLKGSGAMTTGWQSVGSTWYYFKGSGVMVTGWQQIGGSWYYFNASGAMLTGWQLIGNTWYYFYGSGAMAANTSIGGYKLSASGAMV